VAQLKLSGSLLARNTMLNFIGQAVPLLVGVLIIPFIVRGLGIERFGILSLAWVVLGYFTIFDLGLGRATTKYVAEALGKGEEDQVPRLVWASVTIQAILGFIGTVILVSITPFLVERILNIPPELVREAKATFYLLSLAIPVVLVSGSFRGVLEASQRFDLVNAVKIASNTLIFILPLAGLLLGFSLPGIIVLIGGARLGALFAFVVISVHIIPRLKKYSVSFVLFPRLFSFGGWVTVTTIVWYILWYLSHFLIGSLLSMAAVAYYAAPYEAVTRLGIIAGSLTMTLFPAFSALGGIKDRQRLGSFFARSIKYVLLILGPVVLVIAIFAEAILQTWLGTDFATRSKGILQIITVGMLIYSLAHTPYALLEGIGRPDLPAKFYLIELPVSIAITWILVSQWGIVGGAVAWSFRVTLDAVLIFIAVFKVCGFSLRVMAGNNLIRSILALSMLGILLYFVKSLMGNFSMLVVVSFVLGTFAILAYIIWVRILDISDRKVLLNLLKGR
jgi:O-antigen/teichoic acid export membrane protein